MNLCTRVHPHPFHKEVRQLVKLASQYGNAVPASRTSGPHHKRICHCCHHRRAIQCHRKRLMAGTKGLLLELNAKRCPRGRVQLPLLSRPDHSPEYEARAAAVRPSGPARLRIGVLRDRNRRALHTRPPGPWCFWRHFAKFQNFRARKTKITTTFLGFSVYLGSRKRKKHYWTHGTSSWG